MLRVKRIVGVILMAVSALGVLLSLSGIFIAMRYRGRVIDQGTQFVTTLISGVQTAENSLVVTGRSLDQAQLMLDAVRGTIADLRGTLRDIDPVLESMASVMGGDLPEIISTTQDSLDTVQESAQTVNHILYALDTISFLTGVHYDPELPLAESVDKVGKSPDDLPSRFSDLEESISVALENVDEMGAEIKNLEDALGNLERYFEQAQQAQTAVSRSQAKVSGIEGNLERIQENLSRWLNILSTGLAFFLFWLGVIQVGLFFQGLEMFQGEGQVG